LEPDAPDPEKALDGEPLPNSAADEFIGKMNHDFRRPKPSEEAVAAALQAIQKLTSDVAAESETQFAGLETACPKCGGPNSGTNRFCGYCGTLLDAVQSSAAAKLENPQTPPAVGTGQHLYHHHYHHHYFSDSAGKAVPETKTVVHRTEEVVDASRLQPLPTDPETVIQRLVQNWALYCNARRLDDLVALYSADAIVIRPNADLAHGTAAIRQLLSAALQSGLGDVELECADIGIIGEFACLTGLSKMLVPSPQENATSRQGSI